MSGLTLVESASNVYHAGAKRGPVRETRFVFFIPMSSSSDAQHTSRAKLQKIVREEFASQLRGEVKTATDDLKQTTKDELNALRQDLLGRFKLIATCATVVISLVFMIVGFYVYRYVPEMVQNQIHSTMEPLRGEIGPIKERLTKLETASDLLEKFKKMPTQDSVYLNAELSALTDTLRDAKQKDIIFDPKDIEQIGQNLINVHYQNPDAKNVAWNTLNQVLAYRSFLNFKLYAEASFATIRPIDRKTNAVALDYTPTDVGLVFKGFVFENVTQALDGIGWEHVIFRNSTIRYSGKPTRLKNVAFENCRFEFAQEPPAIDLSKGVLASNIVNYAANRAEVLNSITKSPTVLATSKHAW